MDGQTKAITISPSLFLKSVGIIIGFRDWIYYTSFGIEIKCEPCQAYNHFITSLINLTLLHIQCQILFNV